MTGIEKWSGSLGRPTSILPLVIFRMAFGMLMCISQLRFIYKGWVEACFTDPGFHFTYQFFPWVRPFDTTVMYFLVALSALFALMMAVGLYYRLAAAAFFILFTYLELVEKSWYLNHYYLVSLLAFLLIWLPAHRKYSLDAARSDAFRADTVPAWTILLLQAQLALVYFFGGLAKLKADWLWEAQPLRIWLHARADLPLLGGILDHEFTAFLFSWGGMLFDLGIPFLLFHRKTRLWAYLLVVVFHTITGLLFPIGMFPWIMTGCTLIFFTEQEWQNIQGYIRPRLPSTPTLTGNHRIAPATASFLLVYLLLQLGLPLRHFLYTDHILWSENGFRFSWHVMVMEKSGFTEFTVVDHENGKKIVVYPSAYLTPIQERQMSFQPDMIWQFAHYLGERYAGEDTSKVSVYVRNKVSLNGRPSGTLLDPETDLMAIPSMDAVYDAVLAPEEGPPPLR